MADGMCNPFLGLYSCGDDLAAKVFSAATNDNLKQLSAHALESYGKGVGSLGTLWVRVPTPVLTGGNGSSKGGGTPPDAEAFSTILGYTMYGGLVLAGISLMLLAVLIAMRMRHGESVRNLGGLGAVLGGILLLSSSGAIVSYLLDAHAPGGSSTAVGFLQNSLWYYTGGMAVLSILVGGAKMAWEQRAQPGKEVLQSLLTLLIVSGGGLSTLALAVAASDSLAGYLLKGATGCDVENPAQAACFGANVATLINLTASSPIGILAILFFATIASLATYVQIALMVLRSSMLVLLAGVLPLSASFTNLQIGRQWSQKVFTWTIAFVLYKPAAAFVYAGAFQLVGTNMFAKDEAGLFTVISGVGLMLVALVALPALMKLLAPMTSALSNGAGSGAALAAAGGAAGVEAATGAIRLLANRGGGGGGGESSASGAKPTGPAAPQAGPGPSSSPSGAGTPASASGAGATGAGAGSAAGAGAGAGAGAATGAGSGAAAGAAAAGPAAPIVLGAKVAADAVAAGAQAAKGAAQSAAQDSTGQ